MVTVLYWCGLLIFDFECWVELSLIFIYLIHHGLPQFRSTLMQQYLLHISFLCILVFLYTCHSCDRCIHSIYPYTTEYIIQCSSFMLHMSLYLIFIAFITLIVILCNILDTSHFNSFDLLMYDWYTILYPQWIAQFLTIRIITQYIYILFIGK